MFKHHCLASTIIGSALLMGGGALAQTAAPPTGARAPEEVIVTALKRPSRERKTPISMEVLTSATIAQKAIVDVQSLAQQDASVNFVTNNGEGVVAIRGIATQNTTEIGDPSVPISTDGFFTSRPYTFNESLYDVARIEVLRGPQGTLYGRNATGGVINIVNQEPTKTFGGYQSLTYGNYNTLLATGAVNVPVTDTLQVRASYASNSHDGYRDNGPVGHGDSEDAKSGRIVVAWEPAANFKAVITGQYTHVGGTGATDELINLDYVDGYSHNVTYTGNGTSFPLKFLPTLNIDEKLARWNFAWSDLPFNTTLTYLGGYDTITWHRDTGQTAVDQTNQDPQVFQQNEQPTTQNHELRLSSSADQRLTWQTGLYYFVEDNSLFTVLQDEYGTPQQQPFLSFDYKVHTTSKAAFGQVSYKITPQISLTGGLRYTEDEKSRDGFFALPIFGLTPGFPDHERGKWSKVTWHAEADYSPTNDTFIYAKADKGYKSGGFDGEAIPQYAPETVQAYEVGAKNRLFNGQLSLNVDGFYEDYSNQQLTTFQPAGPGNAGGTEVLNAGSSQIYGFDVGGHVDIADLAKFDLQATYLHARFGNDVILTVPDPSGVPIPTPVGGEQLPQAPDFAVTAGLEKTVPTYRGSLTARIETKYQSSEFLHIFNYADSEVKAHTTSNAYLRYDDAQNRYLIELYVRNLENSLVLADAVENVGGPEKFYQFGFDPPRTYGVRAQVNF